MYIDELVRLDLSHMPNGSNIHIYIHRPIYPASRININIRRLEGEEYEQRTLDICESDGNHRPMLKGPDWRGWGCRNEFAEWIRCDDVICFVMIRIMCFMCQFGIAYVPFISSRRL